MIPSKKKKIHQRVHHYTLSTTQILMKRGARFRTCYSSAKMPITPVWFLIWNSFFPQRKT